MYIENFNLGTFFLIIIFYYGYINKILIKVFVYCVLFFREGVLNFFNVWYRLRN